MIKGGFLPNKEYLNRKFYRHTTKKRLLEKISLLFIILIFLYSCKQGLPFSRKSCVASFFLILGSKQKQLVPVFPIMSAVPIRIKLFLKWTCINSSFSLLFIPINVPLIYWHYLTIIYMSIFCFLKMVRDCNIDSI